MVVAQKMRGAQQLQHASSRVATAETVVSTGSRAIRGPSHGSSHSTVSRRAAWRRVVLPQRWALMAAIAPGFKRSACARRGVGARAAVATARGPLVQFLRATPVSDDAQFRAGKVEAMSLLQAAISNRNGTAGWAHSRRITLAAMRKVAV